MAGTSRTSYKYVTSGEECYGRKSRENAPGSEDSTQRSRPVIEIDPNVSLEI